MQIHTSGTMRLYSVCMICHHFISIIAQRLVGCKATVNARRAVGRLLLFPVGVVNLPECISKFLHILLSPAFNGIDIKSVLQAFLCNGQVL